MKNSKKQSKGMPVVNIGTASLVVILVGMCFAVLAALAAVSAKNDYNMSKKLAGHTSEYYVACNKANEQLVEKEYEDDEHIDFEVIINDNQSLAVEAIYEGDNLNILKWQVENTGDWNNDNNLPVLK